MKQKIAARVVEVEGLEMIDMGDAMAETKQPHAIQAIKDSCCTWTWFAEE